MEEVNFRLKSLKYEPDYRKIIRSKEEFKDSLFKADDTSIFSTTKSKLKPETLEKWKFRMEWRRIKNIFKNDEITIVDNVSPNDVKQGQIGDWYFMSTLMSTALRKKLLKIKTFKM